MNRARVQPINLVNWKEGLLQWISWGKHVGLGILCGSNTKRHPPQTNWSRCGKPSLKVTNVQVGRCGKPSLKVTNVQVGRCGKPSLKVTFR